MDYDEDENEANLLGNLVGDGQRQANPNALSPEERHMLEMAIREADMQEEL